ncbi:membrane protein [Bacillus freudenreichii]|nr:membrane protein [Bacillus freudenreichii]
MIAQELIEENNRKRELLTPENGTYYSDMLIYIRLQWSLSEQQSEEVLMEMLDHLLDGQEEGKTAKDIFGDDPKSFANEIIEQLPHEKKRTVIPFVAAIGGNIVSWVLMIRGILILVLSYFTEVNTEINLFVTALVSLMIACFVVLTTWYILKLVNNTLFKENRNDKVNMLKAGLVGAAGMGAVLLTAKLTPEIGPSIDFPWWVSLLAGTILWLIIYVEKKD